MGSVESVAVKRSRESIRIEVASPAALEEADWDEIWEVTRHYVLANREFFEGKLREHSEVGLFRLASGRLIGVAGIDAYESLFRGRRCMVLFTSSVVIEDQFRGRYLLQRLGLRTFIRSRMRNPLTAIFWLFDSFSYKSYVMLARYFGQYWPSRRTETPADIVTFIDNLARERYGEDWKPELGIVRRSGHKRLRSITAPLTAEVLADPDIKFFADSNPGHAQGDMLVCLCPLTIKNWILVILNTVRFAIRKRRPRRYQA